MRSDSPSNEGMKLSPPFYINTEQREDGEAGRSSSFHVCPLGVARDPPLGTNTCFLLVAVPTSACRGRHHTRVSDWERGEGCVFYSGVTDSCVYNLLI